jgi:hypothetical protein
MEHPGAIFYNASGLMLDETATQNQQLERASVISHETAHMWFGDLVTMRWFTDVWMKEVFANFLAAKIVNPSFSGVNHELRFLLQNYPAAYDVDRTAGANPIRQGLDNLNGAGSLYGAIIYQKAPIVMRQLEVLTGADAFRQGLRGTPALRLRERDLDRSVGLSTRAPPADRRRGAAWVDEPGRPVIRTDVLDHEQGASSGDAAPGGPGRARLALAADIGHRGPTAPRPHRADLDRGGRPSSPRPPVPGNPGGSCRSAAGLFNGHGHTRLPFPIAGDVAARMRRTALVDLWEAMLEETMRRAVCSTPCCSHSP